MNFIYLNQLIYKQKQNMYEIEINLNRFFNYNHIRNSKAHILNIII